MLTFCQHAHRACFRAWSQPRYFDHLRSHDRHLDLHVLLIFTAATGQGIQHDRFAPRVRAPSGFILKMALKCQLFTVVHHMSTLFAISPVSGCPGNIHSHWPVVWWPSTWYHRWKWLPWLLARLWRATSSIFVSTHNWKHSPVFFFQWLSINFINLPYDHLWSLMITWVNTVNT